MRCCSSPSSMPGEATASAARGCEGGHRQLGAANHAERPVERGGLDGQAGVLVTPDPSGPGDGLEPCSHLVLGALLPAVANAASQQRLALLRLTRQASGAPLEPVDEVEHAAHAETDRSCAQVLDRL